MKKNLLNIFIILILSKGLNSQTTVAGIKFNKLTAYISSNGKLFDSLSYPGLFAKFQGNLIPLVESAGIWLYGQDANNIHYFSAHNILSNNDEFWAGPLDTNNANSANPSDWNNVYKIYQHEIDSHRRSFRNSNYEILTNVKNWPGSGEESYATILAPFADYQINDKKYNPENGDFPIIKGDAMLYTIYNDNYANHSFTNGQPLEIEIKTSVFGLEDNIDTQLNNVLIVRYVLHNRGQTDFLNFKFGQAIKFKIGNNYNEFLGTDIKNRTFFGFNDTSEAAFGKKFVSLGCMMLNQELGSTIYFENNSNSVNGFPTQLFHFVNYMNSTWKNGQNLTFGSNGVDGSGTSNYIYSYDTDDSNNNINWNEISTGNPSGERIGLMTTKALNFKPKETKVIELAYFFVEENKFNFKQYQEYCLKLKEDLLAQNLLRNENLNNSFEHSFSIYPNPTNSKSTLYVNNTYESDVLMNLIGIDGKVIFQQILQNEKNELYLPQNLESGIYYIEFKSLNNTTYKKLIIYNY